MSIFFDEGPVISGSIEFLWSVDGDESPYALQVFANNIVAAGRYLDDMTPVLVGAHQIISDDIRDHFIKEEGPGGPWAYWAPSYTPKALSENIGILRKTEELFDAATDQHAWFITENDLWFNPNDLPPWWVPLNFGRRNTPMPARPFLWTSDEAVEKIGELFYAWGSGVDFVLSGRGYAQLHTPQFGPIVGLGTIFPTR